jgi:flavin reductase (DIM6/NTAB) family NADH-FMN oxidoreductase RutF
VFWHLGGKMVHYNLHELKLNIFDIFDKNWALLTAGDINERNTMTISWGCLGTLWNKSVAIIFIRPTRYTFHLLQKSERFTLSFLDEKYRNEMLIMGRESGSLKNKYELTGLTPIYDTDTKVSYIKNSKYVMKLKKLYFQKFDENSFIDKSILKNYKGDLSDLSYFCIAELTQLLSDENEI